MLSDYVSLLLGFKDAGQVICMTALLIETVVYCGRVCSVIISFLVLRAKKSLAVPISGVACDAVLPLAHIICTLVLMLMMILG